MSFLIFISVREAKYFHLDECAVKKYINSFEEPADITMQKFVVDFGINLGVFDSANARIIGRHPLVRIIP